ncbi:hypothetical protein PIGHUM_01559 [Pigmentiphaga humi]|uniref:Uncharacterized protein n=1 Tax=Pigmentiphaga humi TaxID=2478468 RepID=A0A3P4B1Q1_9BURK|nr:PP0621 family protein [Pigmentiphaga humi]VCU69496.1 hypothetical protein PIGHUM_01559 [Pigmentiphaga humi]
MGKILFWLVVILVALLVARIAARSAVKGQRQASRRADATRFPEGGMVRCAHCGIHLASSEAVRRKGYNYCSLAHSLKGPGK